MPAAKVNPAMPANVALARASALQALRALESLDPNVPRSSRRNARLLGRARASINDAIIAAGWAGRSGSVLHLARAAQQLQTPFGLRNARQMIHRGIALLSG